MKYKPRDERFAGILRRVFDKVRKIIAVVFRRTQNASSSESKPELQNSIHLILWVHRFQETHKDQPGCDESSPAIPNYHPKFRSERFHCRDLMSPLRRTKDIQAGNSCGRGKNRWTRRRTDLRSAAAQPRLEFVIIVISPPTRFLCAQRCDSKCPA